MLSLHIARHLEEIALAALPTTAESEPDDSEPDEQEPKQPSSLVSGARSTSTSTPVQQFTMPQIPQDPPPLRRLSVASLINDPEEDQKIIDHALRSLDKMNSPGPHHWTLEEDDILVTAQESNMTWAAIAADHFPGKSANDCRKRHDRLVEMNYRSPTPSIHSSAEDEAPTIVRCICQIDDDDRSTVLCDSCNTWQHIECYYSDQSIPEIHECGDCNLRGIGVSSAIVARQSESIRSQIEEIRKMNNNSARTMTKLDSIADELGGSEKFEDLKGKAETDEADIESVIFNSGDEAVNSSVYGASAYRKVLPNFRAASQVQIHDEHPQETTLERAEETVATWKQTHEIHERSLDNAWTRADKHISQSQSSESYAVDNTEKKSGLRTGRACDRCRIFRIKCDLPRPFDIAKKCQPCQGLVAGPGKGDIRSSAVVANKL